MQNRFKSWPLWISLSALVVFIFLKITGVDITEPVAALMALLLPVMVGFGIVNDPTTYDALFSDGQQFWYQSKMMWTAIGALVIYCAKWFFNVDLGDFMNGLLEVTLPVLSAVGIIISPTAGTQTK